MEVFQENIGWNMKFQLDKKHQTRCRKQVCAMCKSKHKRSWKNWLTNVINNTRILFCDIFVVNGFLGQLKRTMKTKLKTKLKTTTKSEKKDVSSLFQYLIQNPKQNYYQPNLNSSFQKSQSIGKNNYKFFWPSSNCF